jgi:hypothetical protein
MWKHRDSEPRHARYVLPACGLQRSFFKVQSTIVRQTHSMEYYAPAPKIARRWGLCSLILVFASTPSGSLPLGNSFQSKISFFLLFLSATMTSLSLLIACLVLFWFVASHPSLTQRGEAVDNPTAANFLRRVYHECECCIHLS